MHNQETDEHTADEGHHIAGSPEDVRQEQYTGTDRTLHQMHERGKVSATILIARWYQVQSFCILIELIQ